MKTWQRRFGLVALTALAGLALLLLLAWGVTWLRFRLAPPPAPLNQPQFWSHHGLTAPGIEKNSLPALELAAQAGALGLELDIEYDFKTNAFVLLGFDTPLYEVFTRLAPAHPQLQFWLDYKPMDQGDPSLLAPRLRELVQAQGLMQRVWVESWHKKALVYYKQAGFRTLYWAAPRAAPGSLEGLQEWHKIRAYLVQHQHDGVSGDVENWGPDQRQALGNWPLFLFTVNRRNELPPLLAHTPLQVILTDRADWLSQGEVR